MADIQDARERAKREYQRQVRESVIQGVHVVWKSIDDRHQATTDAFDLVEDGLVDDYLTRAIADLSATQEIARQGLQDLARLAVEDRNLSARTVAGLAGVSHSTLLRWLSPDD